MENSGQALLERVARIISRYSMFANGEKIGVAVSGGPDSVALLHILYGLAPRWQLKLHVLHLNHLLRGDDARGDASFVVELASELGVPCEVQQADVASLACTARDNLEQAARQARRRFFNSFLESGSLEKIALGHTRSDQAETVLFRLLRGSGITGLAGIRPVTREGIVRPLIGLQRAEVLQFLQSRGLAWREDITNADLRFARNRIRHQLLPQLTESWNPALADCLANLAELSQAEELYWEREIARLGATHLITRPPAVVFQANRLAALDEAAARRLLRRAVELTKGDTRRLQFEHVEQMLGLARLHRGEGRVVLPGLELTRSFDWLRLAPQEKPAKDYRIVLEAPGRLAIPVLNKALLWDLGYQSERDDLKLNRYTNERGGVLSMERVTEPLELTNFRPGDRFWPAGASGPVKVKVLFHRSKVPSWERPAWPIIRSGETVVWIRHFGTAEGWTPRPGSERVLRIREIDEQS